MKMNMNMTKQKYHRRDEFLLRGRSEYQSQNLNFCNICDKSSNSDTQSARTTKRIIFKIKK